MPLLPDQLGAGALELRRSRPCYLDDIMSAVTLSYPELHRWINWCKSMPLRQDILKFLEEDERAFEVDEKWAYALFERDSGELVGSAGLRKVSAPATDGLEIGYWVRSDRTKLGYASAAAQALVDAGFAKMPGIKRMRISMDSANEASAAVPRKLGFRFLGNEKGELATEGHTGAGAVWELERPW